MRPSSLALATAALAAGALVAAAAGAAPEQSSQLPRGGREVFPRFRVVAFYGAPQHRNLGILGIGSPDRAAAKLRRQAAPYRRGGKPVLPAFELIASIALAAPGRDGRYRGRQSARVIGGYLRAARRAKALLLLDIQPGRSTFMAEARALERWLREPDVGLALDPEWNMGPRGVPGRRIGSVDAGRVNELSAWLDGIARARGLPQKLLVVHQFTDGMIRRKHMLRRRRRVAVIVNIDGFGTRAVKIDKYRHFTRRRDRLYDGLKLFYREDTKLLTPGQVLGLRPRPDLIVYE